MWRWDGWIRRTPHGAMSGAEMDRLERRLRADVKKYGWHVLNVFSNEGGPGWSYSVGLYHTLRHPEIAIIGLPPGVAHQLINDAGNQVRDGEHFVDRAVSAELLKGYSCTFQSVPAPSMRATLVGRSTSMMARISPCSSSRIEIEEMAVGGGRDRGFPCVQPALAVFEDGDQALLDLDAT